jgi:hypothetical protein
MKKKGHHPLVRVESLNDDSSVLNLIVEKVMCKIRASCSISERNTKPVRNVCTAIANGIVLTSTEITSRRSINW